MAADAGAEEHAGVLHLAGRIQQLRADDAHFRSLGMLQQHFQPIVLRDLDVVVQEQQVFAVGRRGCKVVEARPVEGFRSVDDAIGILLQPDLPCHLAVGDVVDADDLVIRVRRPGAQRCDAVLDVTLRSAGRDDDRNLAGGLRGAPQAPGAGQAAGQHLSLDAAAGRRIGQRGAGRAVGIQRFRATLRQQFRNVVDGCGCLGAAQYQIVFAVAQQRARRGIGAPQQRGGGEPRPAYIVGGQQQVGGKIRLEEWLALARGGTDARLVGVEKIGAAVQPGCHGDFGERIHSQFVTRA